MHGTHLKRVSALAVVIGIFLATLFAAPSMAQGPTVDIRGTTFSTYHFHPRKVEVVPGTVVHWSWHSNAPHNVTFTKLGKQSETGTDVTYRLRFNNPGTYRYLCTVHGFTGVVVAA